MNKIQNLLQEPTSITRLSTADVQFLYTHDLGCFRWQFQSSRSFIT